MIFAVTPDTPILILADRPEDAKVAQSVLIHLRPQGKAVIPEPVTMDQEGVALHIGTSVSPAGISTKGTLCVPGSSDRVWEDFDTSILDPRFGAIDWDRRRNERVRRAVVGLLSPDLITKVSLFWGILFGVRPTKVVHRLLDKDFSPRECKDILMDNFMLSVGKAELLTDVAVLQRKHLSGRERAATTVSIYLGIPFCPTRCHYCSFAAYPLGSHGHLVKGFIEGLKREIREVGAAFRDLGLSAQTVYIGGGTPSSLGAGNVRDILSLLRSEFRIPEGVEFTFEAGRPDTITPELLDALQDTGVDRISVNPQTMNPRTLSIIGRAHTPEDVRRAMELAKPRGFKCINMDIILGLPGETVEDVGKTLEGISAMGPDSITVHTLSIKHASKWRANLGLYEFPTDTEVLAMLEESREMTASLGMIPYYLYRQRFIAADLENVGYALPGLESVYNIQMMEERQSIIGLGGGGVTKFVTPGSWTLERHFNPKCPATFHTKYDALVKPKIQSMMDFFSGIRNDLQGYE